MPNSKIKFYPVDNGDTTLIKLEDGFTILIDCKIREITGDNDPDYDVKEDLLKELSSTYDGKPFVNLFILTHPDQDHCLGFQDHFYTGDPSNYSEADKDNNLIIVNELWVTSMVFSYGLSKDANAVRNEANRRKRLHQDFDWQRNDKGNKLRLIGYDENERYDNVPNSIPGEIIDSIDDQVLTTLSLFLHSPFKDTLVESKADNDRNATSIVVQARFKKSWSDSFCTLALLGGDADHHQWAEIIKQSEGHGNDAALYWDLLLAPHHCSWTYFNDVPYSDNKTATESSLELLKKYRNNGGKVIASSKTIKKDDDTPPHYPAKTEYLKKLDKEEDFLNTAIEGGADGPLPIIFEITANGPRKESASKSANKNSSAGSRIPGSNLAKHG